jgi:SWI/SNF-related matrix-associated actin-dependent regulator 1 of chromatin subfamily A
MSIKVIDSYTVECTKPEWSSEDRFLASCLDIKEVDNKHIVDVRIVSKKALNYYLQKTFPALMTSFASQAYRKALFLQFSGLYQRAYDDFMRDYYPKAGYKDAVGIDMYKHQIDTMVQCINRKNNLLGLEMGLGKTLTAATISKVTSARRTIVIAPASVKWNWYFDLTRNWGFSSLYWTVLDSKKSKTIKAFQERFVVLNFEQVRKYMDYLLSDEINHIIIDEVHMLKNPTSGRSKAVHELIERSGFPRLTMLSGTPVTNRINDMFNYLKMSKHPLGGNFKAFKEKYTISTGGSRGKIIGAQNIQDLKGKVSNMFIRMKSEDCLDLPDMIIKNYYLEKSDISSEYEEELQNLRDKKAKYDTLHGVEKQKMNTEIKGNIHTLNRIVTTSKVPKIKELIDRFIENGEKVVVFAGYKDPLRMLEEIYGEASIRIDGSVDSHKRQTLIDKFRDKDGCKVFLGNYVAAGVGINLVNARRVIMMNMPFVPAEIEQAQKRLHRSGQKQTVHVYYAIATETIDDHIYSILHDKSEDINELIDGDHKAVINYGNIQNELFRKLLEK